MKEFTIKFYRKETARWIERRFIMKFADIYEAIHFAESIKKPEEGYEIR